MVLIGNQVVPPLRFAFLVLAVRAQGKLLRLLEIPAILQTLYRSWLKKEHKQKKHKEHAEESLLEQDPDAQEAVPLNGGEADISSQGAPAWGCGLASKWYKSFALNSLH